MWTEKGYGLVAGLWFITIYGVVNGSGLNASISENITYIPPLPSMASENSTFGHVPLEINSESSTSSHIPPVMTSDNSTSSRTPFHVTSENSIASQMTSRNSTSNRTQLHMMHLYWQTSRFLTVHFALEDINSRADILTDYELLAHYRYVGRGVGSAMKEFINLYETRPVKLMILGPPNSDQCQVVADVGKYYGLVEVAQSSSPVMSDQRLYPLFSRLKESTTLNLPAIMYILRHFRWRKVAKIVDDQAYISPTAQNLQVLLDAANMTTLANPTYTGRDPALQMRQIKDVGAKIIISFGDEYCTAYHLGMYGPRYQWLHWSGPHGGLSSFERGRNGNCTTQQIRTMMDGMFIFSPISAFLLDQDVVGISGYSSRQLEGRFASWVAARNLTDRGINPREYDIVWVAAMALNVTAAHGVDLSNFTYGNQEMALSIHRAILGNAFQGASGKIAFDENGDRNSEVVISQVQGEAIQTVGVYSPFTRQVTWTPEYPPKFPGGYPPRDSLVVVYQEIHTSLVALYSVCALCALGILGCVGCIIFNVHFAELRIVKLSSPRINTLIAVGCAMGYISVILVGLDGIYHSDSNGTIICNLKVWLLVLGFTLSFGGMFSKTWRVHVLFTNKKMTRKVVRDHHLIAMVSLLAFADAVILGAWTFFDPRQWTILLPTQTEDDDAGVLLVSRVYVCTSHHATYWTGAVAGFKALLLIFGMFFAWETRQVRVEALNDSKQIGVCVYNVMLTSAIAVPLVNLLSVSQVGMAFGVTAAAVIICATSTLGLLFGAKMYLMATKGAQVEDLTQLPFAASVKGSHLAERGTVTAEYTRDMQTVPEDSQPQGTPHCSTLHTTTKE